MQEIISRAELVSLVNDIIGKIPDLMVRLAALEGVCALGMCRVAPEGRCSRPTHPFCLMLLLPSFLPSLQTGFHEFLVKCETMDLDMSALGRAGAPPVVGAAQRDALRHKGLTRDKLLSKPLSEIVAHETERVTPSYVKIPADYPKLSCSGRTEVRSGK